jgi:3-isopropylmalate/(R)-2-methylmalate dehydratase small subunit
MKHGMDVIARHCLESLRPDFAGGVRPGDLLVAGPNFGIGSSREQAAAVLVALGVQAGGGAQLQRPVFFRNAFNVGLLLLTCAQAERLEEGERVGLDHADPLAAGLLRAGGERLTCDPVPPFLVERVRCGGLLNELKQRLARGTP